MSYVAAYTVSAYATTSNRTGKPFNPLLGETYECDRTDDFGWRCVSEQVNMFLKCSCIYRDYLKIASCTMKSVAMIFVLLKIFIRVILFREKKILL